MASAIPVNIPKQLRPGVRTALSAEYINSQREAIMRLASRKYQTAPPVSENTLPPFSLSLRYSAGAYYVSVTDGYVIETDLTKGEDTDAITYHECPSRVDANGYPEELEIAEDEAVFVQVQENEAGAVGLPSGGTGEVVDVVVLAKTTKSLNYIPTIQNGIYYYKLAELVTVDGNLTLVPYAAGSHVYKTSGLTADVIIEDCSGDQYAEPYEPGLTLIRQSFISGVLVELNASETARPVAAAIVREPLTPCSGTEPP